MPIYEYQCRRCNETFEVMQKFSDAPLTIHQDCGGEVERLLSPPALQFKGSGWYVTDYARNGSAKASDGSDKSDKTENKSAAKSETKAKAKSETTTSSSKSSATEK